MRAWFCLALCVLSAWSLQAQTPPVSKVAFDVASIKLNKMIDAPRNGVIQPGRFAQLAVSARSLIRLAYVPAFSGREIVGGPEWIDTERFDVEARGNFQLADYLPLADGSPALVYQMLQTLLGERFRLQVHVEARERPVYRLVMANRDGRLGPQLKRSDIDCAATLAAFAKTGSWQTPPRPGTSPPCSSGGGKGHLHVEDLSMSQIAAILTGSADRPVKDGTGLSGNFDLTLDYSADDLLTQPGAVSLFTAVQEQLGLRLEPARGAVEVVVVDRVERPTTD